MKSFQISLDRIAISLSFACALHCLLAPVIVVFMPALASTFFADEGFHRLLLWAVFPTSLIGLGLGCKKHQKWSLLGFGGLGILVMLVTVLLGHDTLGEVGEKGATLLGAALISIGHVFNYRLCRRLDCPS